MSLHALLLVAGILVVGAIALMLLMPLDIYLKFPFGTYQTSFWLVVASSIVGGFVVECIAAWRQSRADKDRIRDLESQLRRAKLRIIELQKATKPPEPAGEAEAKGEAGGAAEKTAAPTAKASPAKDAKESGA